MQKLFKRAVVAFMLLELATFYCSLPAVAADGVTRSREIQAVPFKLVRGHMIVVKCSIGGLKNITAIVDTGASETVVDMALVRRLSLAVQADRATFIAQEGRVWAVAIPELELGPIVAGRLDAIATDLSSLTTETGIRPQVLIGMDFLRRSSFIIDYRSQRLIFAPAEELLQLPHHAALVSMSAESGSHLALIESSIMERTVKLQVDSGFDGVLVYSNRLPELRWARRTESPPAHLANVAQALAVHSFNSQGITVGGWRSPGTQITVVDGPGAEPAEFDGLLGTAFLSKTRVAFDFQNGILYWE